MSVGSLLGARDGTMSLSARLRGLAAAVALAGLLVGLPWVLIQSGPPTSGYGWAWAALVTELTAADDGTLALVLFKVVGWITWAGLAHVILVRIRNLEPADAPAALGDSERSPDLDQPWRQRCDQAGQLPSDLSMAATDEDLATLAPHVTAVVRTQVTQADPTLDADLARWRDPACPVPRLSLLGPVTLRLPAGRPDLPEAIRRRALLLDLLAFLALHPQGVSRDQIADALGVTQDRVRKYVSVLRQWLGADPATRRQHVPESTQSAAARTRGVHLYQLEGVLVDADLFRRLRVRGQAAGPDGIQDLRDALSLVTGRPLDQLRTKSGLWLGGTRYDHVLAAAVVEVAHVLALDAVQRREYAEARGAAEVATVAAPYDEVATLDLVAAVRAEGRVSEADRILRSQVFAPFSDDDAPGTASRRAGALTKTHGSAGGLPRAGWWGDL